MEASIAISGADSPQQLESLHEWLSGEPNFAGRISRLAVPPRDSELGTLTDALVVAVGAGGGLSVLASSLHAWLSQPRRANLIVKISGKDGAVEVRAENVDRAALEGLLSKTLCSSGEIDE